MKLRYALYENSSLVDSWNNQREAYTFILGFMATHAECIDQLELIGSVGSREVFTIKGQEIRQYIEDLEIDLDE